MSFNCLIKHKVIINKKNDKRYFKTKGSGGREGGKREGGERREATKRGFPLSSRRCRGFGGRIRLAPYHRSRVEPNTCINKTDLLIIEEKPKVKKGRK